MRSQLLTRIGICSYLSQGYQKEVTHGNDMALPAVMGMYSSDHTASCSSWRSGPFIKLLHYLLGLPQGKLHGQAG